MVNKDTCTIFADTMFNFFPPQATENACQWTFLATGYITNYDQIY